MNELKHGAQMLRDCLSCAFLRWHYQFLYAGLDLVHVSSTYVCRRGAPCQRRKVEKASIAIEHSEKRAVQELIEVASSVFSLAFFHFIVICSTARWARAVSQLIMVDIIEQDTLSEEGDQFLNDASDIIVFIVSLNAKDGLSHLNALHEDAENEAFCHFCNCCVLKLIEIPMVGG